jgi:hypothetical protein
MNVMQQIIAAIVPVAFVILPGYIAGKQHKMSKDDSLLDLPNDDARQHGWHAAYATSQRQISDRRARPNHGHSRVLHRVRLDQEARCG